MIQSLYLSVYTLMVISGITGTIEEFQYTIPPVEVEIRYYAPEAGEVFLVWGVDGWQILAETIGPDGTEIKNKLLYTPMEREEGYFIATIQIPSKAKLDYGFLVTQLVEGRRVSIWDETRLVTGRSIVDGKEIIEVKGDLEATLRKLSLHINDILVPLLFAVGIIAGVYAALHFGKQKYTRPISLLLLIAILIIGLAIRLQGSVIWNSYHPDSAERLIGDEPGYDNMARELIQGYGFTWPGRVPIYPLWLAGIYALTGGSYLAVIYAQSILGVLTLLLTFIVGNNLFDKKTGLLAAGWGAISYVQVHQGFHYLSEILYTPILLITVLAFWKAWRNLTPVNFVIAGFWLGLSNLVKPTLLLFPVFILIVLVIFMKNKQALRCGLMYLTTSLLVVSPWLVHNYVRYNALFPLQTSNAILWQGSPEYYRLIQDRGYTYNQIWKEVLYGPGWENFDPNSIEGDQYWTKRALRSIAAEPLLYLKYAGEKLFTFWIGDPNADWDNTYPFNYSALIRSGFLPKDAVQFMLSRAIPLIALAAGLMAFRQWRTLLPLYLVMIYINLIHALTHAEARLSDPLQPLLLVIISGAVTMLLDPLRVRTIRFQPPAPDAEGD